MRKTRIIEASEAKQQFDQVVDQVSREKTRVVLEKNGSPLAAIIPAHDLRRLQGLDAEEDALMARMRAAFSDLSEEQIVVPPSPAYFLSWWKKSLAAPG